MERDSLSLPLKGVDGFCNPSEIVEDAACSSKSNPVSRIWAGIRRETGQEEEEDASSVVALRVGETLSTERHGWNSWKTTTMMMIGRSNEDLEEQLSSKGWRALMETYTRGIKRSVFGEPPRAFSPIDTRYVVSRRNQVFLFEKTPRTRFRMEISTEERNRDGCEGRNEGRFRNRSSGTCLDRGEAELKGSPAR